MTTQDQSASSAAMMLRFDTLAEFFGSGRKLTQMGNLTLADARTLVDLLGLDDKLSYTFQGKVTSIRSSEELPELSLTLRWAMKAGVLRKVHGRLVATATWAKATSAQRLARCLDVLAETGPMTLWSDGASGLAAIVDEAFPALLRRLSGGPLDLESATEELCEHLEGRYQFNRALDTPDARRRWFGRDLLATAELLDLAGVVTTESPVSRAALKWNEAASGVVTLTELGRSWAVEVAIARADQAGGFRYVPPPVRSLTLHEVRVTLDGSRPQIWRKVLVPSGLSLRDLHRVLQVVMGWEDYHLHHFKIGGVRYAEPAEDEDYDMQCVDERDTLLATIAPAGSSFTYEYDFGDSWEHTIEVLAVTPMANDSEDGEIPRCTGGGRSCPPEDVGGVWGYQGMVEALNDPSHEEHDSFRQWAPDGFDPERFDVAAVNSALRQEFSERALALRLR